MQLTRFDHVRDGGHGRLMQVHEGLLAFLGPFHLAKKLVNVAQQANYPTNVVCS